MKTLVLYFQAHQPKRIKTPENVKILERIAKNCYQPFLKICDKFKLEISLNFGITGQLFDQLIQHNPDLLLFWKQFILESDSEIINETYNHSLAFYHSQNEFYKQVTKHQELIERVFDKECHSFRNTELLYDNNLAIRLKEQQKYYGNSISTILTEGCPWMPHSPFSLYRHPTSHQLIATRDNELSDHLGFRFSDQDWEHYPLTPEKYLKLIKESNKEILILGWDLETFGEHHGGSKETLVFLERLFELIIKDPELEISTLQNISKSIKREVLPILSIEQSISWADQEKDLSAWQGNELQEQALNEIYQLEEQFSRPTGISDHKKWRDLQSSDHFYYMSLKNGADGKVHEYFSPYESGYEAYMEFMKGLKEIRPSLS
jgi:alpha-amylase